MCMSEVMLILIQKLPLWRMKLKSALKLSDVVSFNAYLNIKEVGNLESDATNNIFEKTFPKTYT